MMIPTPHWDEIKVLFDQALELDPAHRADFLAALDTEKPELAKELRELLAETGHTPTYFEQDAIQALGFQAIVADDVVTPPPTRIGPYRISHELGYGGMGRVYLGIRDDGQFEKQVAIKVVKRGMDTDDILTRFRYERQILASLDHPNIAQLFDGGLTEDGRPYFVMEYVAGDPITTYADHQRLTIPQRLALFRTVCRAVEFAHQNLVIHRDLKPSNILVTPDGTVKLLDFGIAKLLDDEQVAVTTPITQIHTRLLTPEYAAPEQVQGGGITTATDVYQLGVVLYELLTGRRPYQMGKRLRFEIERIIIEEEPTKPSTAVTKVEQLDDDAKPEKIGQERGLSLEALQRTLRGDLDMICLKALAKEQERRYRGVGAFAEDVRRYQQRLPVHAQPDRLGYRVQKFVRRHRVGVAAGSAIGVLLLTVVVMAVSFAWVTAEQNTLLAQERDRVTEERNQAEAVRAFVVDLFEVNDPDISGTADVSARTLLQRGTERVRTELAEQPEVQSEMLLVLSQVYGKLSDFAQARQLIEEAIAVQRTHLGDTDPLIGEALGQLGFSLAALGHYAAADSVYQEAATIFETAYGREHVRVAQALSERATVLSYQGGFQEAADVMREATQIQEAVSAPESRALADMHYNAGIVYQRGGHMDAAIAAFQRVLELDRVREGPNSFDVINALIQLGRTMSDDAAYLDEAEAHLEEALAIADQILEPNHRLHAMIHQELGTVYRVAKRPADAVQHYAEALRLQRVNFGDLHPDVVSAIHSLGNVYVELGELAVADSLYQEALRIVEAVYDGPHPDVAMVLQNLAYTRGLQGAYTDADRYFARAIEIFDAVLPERHAQRYHVRKLYGEILLFAGRYAEAESYLLRAYAFLEAEWGTAHARTQSVIRALVDVYQRTGQPTQEAQFRALLVAAEETDSL